MRVLAASLIRIFPAVLFILGTDAAAITFDDGLVHVIDAGNSFPAESVQVSDGPGNSSTTLSIIAGGEIGTVAPGQLVALENSIVSMSGGIIGGSLQLSNQAQASLSGGTTGNIDIRDSSTIDIEGGAFGVDRKNKLRFRQCPIRRIPLS
jgi:hypothetical protein